MFTTAYVVDKKNVKVKLLFKGHNKENFMQKSFCFFVWQTISAKNLQNIKKIICSPPLQNEWCGNHPHYNSFSFRQLPILQTFLFGICMQASGTPVPMKDIIQSFRRTWKGNPVSLNHIHQNRTVGNVYRHQLCGFHSLTRISESKNPYPQDVWRTSNTWEMFHGGNSSDSNYTWL